MDETITMLCFNNKKQRNLQMLFVVAKGNNPTLLPDLIVMFENFFVK
jgi:hypothetical protein